VRRSGPAPASRPIRRLVVAAGVGLIVLGVLGFLAPSASDLFALSFQSDLERELQRGADLARWAGMRVGASGRCLAAVTAWQVTDASPRLTVGPGGGRRRLGSGRALCRIEIPSVDLSAVVVDGVEPEHLARGPGRYPGTADPGTAGNCCIAGHRVTFGHPFRRLDEVQSGDEIDLTADGVTYRYRVIACFAVPSSDNTPLQDSGLPELTLTTCHPPHGSTQRLVVQAVLTSPGEPRT